MSAFLLPSRSSSSRGTGALTGAVRRERIRKGHFLSRPRLRGKKERLLGLAGESCWRSLRRSEDKRTACACLRDVSPQNCLASSGAVESHGERKERKQIPSVFSLGVTAVPVANKKKKAERTRAFSEVCRLFQGDRETASDQERELRSKHLRTLPQ